MHPVLGERPRPSPAMLAPTASAGTGIHVRGSAREEVSDLRSLQAEADGNGSGPTCKFTDHASNAVHGSVAEHEFDLDWYVPSP